MPSQVRDKRLETLVRKTVKEAIEIQFMKLRAFQAPSVSQGEQKEIERLYGRPSRKAARHFKLSV